MYNDASGLGFQLAMYRWEDDMRAARAARAQRADEATADIVIAEYNDLVHRYNALAEAALKAGRAADASQARASAADAELLSKDREIADLNKRLADAAYDLESSQAFWKKEADYYKGRAFTAEAELAELRSQKG